MPAALKPISLAVFLTCCLIAFSHCMAVATEKPNCELVQADKLFEIRSPFFIFRLDTNTGLHAGSWENRLTDRRIVLEGPELELDLADDKGEPKAVKLGVSELPCEIGLGIQEAVFELVAESAGIAASVTYRWNDKKPALHKTVEIHNAGDKTIRLLNVRLGTYRTDAKIVGGEQGFPAYIDDQFFVSLAHPSGWVTNENGRLSLRQYPGIKLAPGQRFRCMETVYGASKAGDMRTNFVDHVRNRMRRVVRGHDKPYAIFEYFGARPDGKYEESEALLLDSISKVAEGQRDSGCHFDLYSIDFWVDYHGDLKKFDPQRFPNGLTKINKELTKLGTAPGLWIDSSWELWSIGGNQAVQHTLNYDPKTKPEGRKSFCRATEPIKSMYVEAFRHHIRENGVRLLKFDNLSSTCSNPNHDHLPGLFATEAIHNAVIEFLHAMDTEGPDVFLMLYWGYRSPWWLLHADTLFDSGIGIEAASPSDLPSPYARQSITQKIDQARWHAKDIPPLGKDSLGIWLSDWGWNSSVGKERWQEGFVMDICRGSLLAQPWSDDPWLTPAERKQMAELIALLKAKPACFINSRFVLGNPWKDEPYGYCCTDGHRAFLALNNCTWADSFLSLQLNSAWGLPDGQFWDLYRWYPKPARLQGRSDKFNYEATIALRPFDVVSLEVVPHGEAPTLERNFPVMSLPVGFFEATRSLDIVVSQIRPETKPAITTNVVSEDESETIVIKGGTPSSDFGGLLVVTTQMHRKSEPVPVRNVGTYFSVEGKIAGRVLPWTPVLGKSTYPSSWQAWRIEVEPSTKPLPFELIVNTKLIELQWTHKAYFVPN